MRFPRRLRASPDSHLIHSTSNLGFVAHGTASDRTIRRTFKKSEHYAAERVYFSDSSLKNREPESSGREELAVARIIQGDIAVGGHVSNGRCKEDNYHRSPELRAKRSRDRR